MIEELSCSFSWDSDETNSTWKSSVNSAKGWMMVMDQNGGI